MPLLTAALCGCHASFPYRAEGSSDGAPLDSAAVDSDVADAGRSSERPPVDGAIDGATSADAGPWVVVGHGTFHMGSPPTEPCRYCAGRESLHRVTLTHDFEIQATAVTQDQYATLMGRNPSLKEACGSDCPVENVSWHEAAEYCNALSDAAGLSACYSCTMTAGDIQCVEAAAFSGSRIYDCPGNRLPTEAEFEYAHRAGTQDATYGGPRSSCSEPDSVADRIAWYASNSDGSPHAVGTKEPNPWQLFDMSGNVWEWCHDWFQPDLGTAAVVNPWGAASGSTRVIRGGYWNNLPAYLRSACHQYGVPEWPNDNTGFRCVRSLREAT